MNIKTVFAFLCFFLFLKLFCWAQIVDEAGSVNKAQQSGESSFVSKKTQISKGMWTASGRFQSDLLYVSRTQSKLINFEGKIGYAFADNWLASAELLLASYPDAFLFRQRFNTQYTFIRQYPVGIYLGFDYERIVEWESKNSEDENRRLDLLIGPMAGFHYSLNRNTVLDFQLRIPLFHYYKYRDFGDETKNGLLNANFSLRFFFGATVREQNSNISYPFAAKQWMIGGAVKAGTGNLSLRSRIDWLNELHPYAGFLFRQNRMLGLRLFLLHTRNVERSALGFSPFYRQYFKHKGKNVFYGELELSIHVAYSVPLEFEREEAPYSGAGLGLGWSRYVAPNIRLDVFLGTKLIKDEDKPGVFIFSTRMDYRCYLRLGLESYLGSKF